MSHTQELIVQRKKKIIVTLAIALVLVIAGIVTGIAVAILNSINNTELSETEGNILYYSESEEKEEEESNVIIVEMEEEQEGAIEEETEESEETEVTTSSKNTTYYIKVNVQANVVTVYKKDSSGEYNTAVKAMLCSVGTATPTSGVYSISDKYTWRLLQGDVYGQYATRITGHILFHSVPYLSKDKSTLEWWEYDKLGTKASLGCVRLTVADAKWIYDNCESGTQVEFYSSEDPGPLGKPTVQKITDDTEVRNWDPTDPDEDNPWTAYLEKLAEEAKKAEEDTEESTENVIEETNNVVKEASTNAVTENTAETNVVTTNTVENSVTSNTVTKENTVNEITTNTVTENEV